MLFLLAAPIVAGAIAKMADGFDREVKDIEAVDNFVDRVSSRKGWKESGDPIQVRVGFQVARFYQYKDSFITAAEAAEMGLSGLDVIELLLTADEMLVLQSNGEDSKVGRKIMSSAWATRFDRKAAALHPVMDEFERTLVRARGTDCEVVRHVLNEVEKRERAA